MNNKKRAIILQRLMNNNPCPATELNFSSPFELLISVILSSRATDTSVNRVTTKLYRIANTPQAILTLGIEKLKSYIKTIGLFNNKTKNIIKTCRILVEKYDGKLPEDQKKLESLPGVGHKTANIIMNTIFNWPTIAVDTHVFRVCNRTKFATGKNVRQVEKKLLKIVPAKFKMNFHNWFVLHGRYTCTFHKPYCESCIIEDLCEYSNKMNYS